MKSKTVLRDTPLAEITLRKYEKPYDMKRRELFKRIMLSVGLLQPGDSRDVIVDVFQSIFDSKEGLLPKEVEDEVIKNREKHKLPMLGITPSNVRRQIRRCKEMFMIERFQGRYRVTENLTLSEVFEEKIERFYLNSIISRVKEYFDAVSREKA